VSKDVMSKIRAGDVWKNLERVLWLAAGGRDALMARLADREAKLAGQAVMAFARVR